MPLTSLSLAATPTSPSRAVRLCEHPLVPMPPVRPRRGIIAAEDHAMRHAIAAWLSPRRAAGAKAHRAAHAAELRAPADRPPQGASTPGPTAPFKPFRTDPLNREPAAKCATTPFKPFRTDPLNREPTAFPDPGLRRGRLPTPNQFIVSMKPLRPANPRDAPHTPRQRRRQEIFAADERR
jgi:hypothetical protein